MSKPSKVNLLSIAFSLCAVLILYLSEALFVPLFVALLNFIKIGFKIFTPKLILLLIREGFFLKVRQVLVRISARFFILTHKPWRKQVGSLRVRALDSVRGLYRWYVGSPLWLRCGIALGVLLLTASSSYVLLALLIIPKPVVDWIKSAVLRSMNKLGITQFLNAIWNYIVPKQLQQRWYLYSKWTLGRRQINASRKLRTRLTQPLNLEPFE